MEGMLLKWTNYLTGWQPRWFVLDNGVLSYYKSQEEVNSGCKGSIKMSVCDIAVHVTDVCRLDLIIPGEQHFYIRASNPKERQQWLVALGTAKASLASGLSHENAGEISPDIVRTKKSELRLYCDLLMQQVHSVKSAVESDIQPNVSKLDEATSLLGATCDTFIQTLEDCMKIANASIAYESPHQHISDSPFPTVSLKNPQKKNAVKPRSASTSDRPNIPSQDMSSSSKKSPRRRTLSENSYSDQSLSDQSSDVSLSRDSSQTNMSQNSNHKSGESDSPTDLQVAKSNSNYKSPLGEIKENSSDSVRTSVNKSNAKIGAHNSISVTSVNSEEEFKDAVEEEKIPTFYSVMKCSFINLQLEKDGGIPVEPFLEASRSLVPIFDKLNATAFAPVKMDFQGNIRKLQQKFSSNPSQFVTLQKMVISEMNAKQHTMSSSATLALLWMKRGLEFIREFHNEVLQGQENLSTAATAAYSLSLKPFHGWVIRGVFAVAVKALPYRDVFLSLLAAPGNKSEGSNFKQSLLSDMEMYVTALDVVIQILNDFYRLHSIDNDDRV